MKHRHHCQNGIIFDTCYSIFKLLKKYKKCYDSGHFFCEHPEMPYVEAAIKVFYDTEDFEWYARVAPLIPYCWD